ncbi:histidine triad nucleotide-binding protein [Novispirillum itersonii]|uniref:Diadenosine tetraphosphate (Ap4A) HIT family hydrolase n=1 Tax=Novispirillum itersonii TaxID=189 RepID=A0A7X0DL89_NOVIT|nr:histidine triad nucleotide-binding protein [Novispirillum itersonii]MBB6209778.1 diadenosine tetraphosphate (Ap4A) HIT family hydrolase [Novispirillum itersonii]
MSYDPNNVFARILRGEIPNNTVYEDDHVLAFHDISPARPVHVLVIPKGPYKSLTEMAQHGKDEEIAALFRAIEKVATLTRVRDSGYRVITNIGEDGGQEVPHLHFHVLGGGPVGPMLKR